LRRICRDGNFLVCAKVNVNREAFAWSSRAVFSLTNVGDFCKELSSFDDAWEPFALVLHTRAETE